MTLVVVVKATLNQCEVIWNKITVVAAILLLVKEEIMLIMEGWEEDGKRIRYFLRFSVQSRNLTYSQG